MAIRNEKQYYSDVSSIANSLKRIANTLDAPTTKSTKSKMYIMTDKQQIEEILLEANAYGLRWEVKTWAQKFIKENTKLTEIQAHQLAYAEWVK